MPHYLFNVLASQDLEKIADYFESKNFEAGKLFFYKFKLQCQQLIAYSNNGNSYAEIKSSIIDLSFEDHFICYELFFEGYFIYYRILDNGVEILRVLKVH